MKTVVEIKATDPTTPGTVSDQQVLELVLTHDARHVRRKVFDLEDGSRMLVDLPEATVLHQGDVLTLDDGTQVAIVAAEEDIYEIRAKNSLHLTELAWHIGNRHLAAEIREASIRILRDHVIKAMLEKLGAEVIETRTPFAPVRGAYSGQRAHHHHDAPSHDTPQSGVG